MIATRSSPCASMACIAATATLLKMQKPIGRALQAWWPGGLTAQKTEENFFSTTRSTANAAAPAARKAALSVCGFMAVSGSRCTVPESGAASRIARTYSIGCTRTSCSSVASGASNLVRYWPTPEAMSWSSMAVRRAGCSGCPAPISCLRHSACVMKAALTMECYPIEYNRCMLLKAEFQPKTANLTAIEQVIAQASRIILGKESQVRLALACILARGHLLIEDLPGVGKTTLAHVLARC